MMVPDDFIVYNMPQMLKRQVMKWDSSDPPNRERDDNWYMSVREKMSKLFEFFETHSLLLLPERLPQVDQVVLRFSDFSTLGQKFLKSGVPDKWLGSFDRPGSKKKPSDVTYLEKQLAKIRG